MNTESESNPAAPKFSGIPAVPGCPDPAAPADQATGGGIPSWLDLAAKLAVPAVMIIVAAGLFNVVPELVRGTKESFNRIAAQADFKANLSHQLFTAFR